jgi:hypothetical protein
MLAARLLSYPSRLGSPNVSDIHSMQLKSPMQLHVYWLSLPEASGPAASLVVQDDEVMRFDCLGKGHGHMHLNVKQSRGYPDETRLYFIEQSIEEQIERSCFELQANSEFAFKSNFDYRIRRLRLDPESAEQAASFVRQTMSQLLPRHQPLPDSTCTPAV